jgi:predicted short-subunit dehydrogenase-like oxidoreductase (DUF2520 family)
VLLSFGVFFNGVVSSGTLVRADLDLVNLLDVSQSKEGRLGEILEETNWSSEFDRQSVAPKMLISVETVLFTLLGIAVTVTSLSSTVVSNTSSLSSGSSWNMSYYGADTSRKL